MPPNQTSKQSRVTNLSLYKYLYRLQEIVATAKRINLHVKLKTMTFACRSNLLNLKLHTHGLNLHSDIFNLFSVQFSKLNNMYLKGVWCLVGEDLVWVFKSVLLRTAWQANVILATSSKVENSVHLSSCELNFVHGILFFMLHAFVAFFTNKNFISSLLRNLSKPIFGQNTYINQPP